MLRRTELRGKLTVTHRDVEEVECSAELIVAAYRETENIMLTSAGPYFPSCEIKNGEPRVRTVHKIKPVQWIMTRNRRLDSSLNI
jgi:hypothetical protein